MKKIIIIGTGAQAKYAITTLEFRNNIRIEGLLTASSNQKTVEESLLGIPVIGGMEVLRQYSQKKVFLVVAVRDNKLKENLVRSVEDKGFTFLNCIHPSAVIAPSAELGTGIIVNPNAVIQPLAKIGNFVMVHAGAIIEHDNIIEDYANIGPGVKLSGWVHVGKGATIGTGTNVIPSKKIGAYAVTGAGSVIIHDVNDSEVVCGVPGSKIRDIKS